MSRDLPPLTLALLFCIAGACAPPREHEPPERPPIGDALALGATLAGIDVEESARGKWHARTAAGRTGGDGIASADGKRGWALSDVLAPSSRALEAATAGPGLPSAGPLRAGATDDNAEFADYLAFLDQRFGGNGERAFCQRIDVRGRRTIRVVDANGLPVPGAVVTLSDETADRVVFTGTTQGDGRTPYHPAAATAALAAGAPALLQVQAGAARASVRLEPGQDSGDEILVRLDQARSPIETVRLDVLFLIDTTGSMGDEIARVQETLLATTERLRGLDQEFDLRYACVVYRDLGDEYVTLAHPFTADIAAFDEELRGIRAGGGGDGPESLNQGLAVAVSRMDWRADAAKLMFLIADAPPHMDYAGDVPYAASLRAAVASGLRIHSIAASGLDEDGTIALRQIAQFTRGKFVFIEYGGDVVASAAAHGVAAPVAANNLDQILFEQVRDEIAGYGRPDGAVAGR